MASIADGVEYLVVETDRRIYGKASWFHHGAGTSLRELRDDLEESRGANVAVGLYPPWLEDNDEVISAVAPHEDGRVAQGVY